MRQHTVCYGSDPSDGQRRNHPESGPPPAVPPLPRRPISGLAIAALLAPLATPISIFFIVQLLHVLAWADTTSLGKVLPLFVYLGAALALGVAAVIRVFASRGRLAGHDYAIAGSLVSAFGLFVTSTLVYPAVAETDRATCLSSIKEVALVLQLYAQDHDGRLPPAGRWCSGVMPYVHYAGILVCPEAPRLRSGYAFNRALSGCSVDKIPHPHTTVLLYESDLGWNGAGGPETLVKTPRHRGKDVFAFADGSARSLRRDQEGTLIWQP